MHAQLASVLKSHPRMQEAGADVTVQDGVVEVRRGEAHAVVLSPEVLPENPLLPHYERVASSRTGVLFVGEFDSNVLQSLPKGVVVQVIDTPSSSSVLVTAVESVLERVELRLRSLRRENSITRAEFELNELIETARAISQERNLDRLLDVILEKSRSLTGADAASIYVVDRENPDPLAPTLIFKLSQNDSVSFESKEFSVPISRHSIAGAAVLERRAINLPDVYQIDGAAPYQFDGSFDRASGYTTRSMITVPLFSAEDEAIGVIQLINKKRMPDRLLRVAGDVDANVVPFQQRDEELLMTVAAQAGVSLENAVLYEEIKRIFEGFVRASVQAIEARDPTTSGHSFRVSVLTTKLAEVVDRSDGGPYADVSFTRRQMKELEYAALLHDFGKIGVREQVLVKAKKLYPSQLEAIRARFDYALAGLERGALEKKLAAITAGAPKGELADLDDILAVDKETMLRAWRVIEQANEPTVLKEGDFSSIEAIGARTYLDANGVAVPLLAPEEIAALQIQKGTLNAMELREIQSHVAHTFEFLSRIPWGKDMRRIPEIAGSHHEKLNGGGYPRGVAAKEIPLESKIMTIADIYDALTARDRPYKKAIPLERALAILELEVKDGNVDGDLVRLFGEAKVYEVLFEDAGA